MLNSSLLLYSGENKNRWEGIIYPMIYEAPTYDSLGNPTGRYRNTFLLGKAFANAGPDVHTGIFLQGIEVSGIFVQSGDGSNVNFWSSLDISYIYLMRTDNNSKVTLKRNSGYHYWFQSSTVLSFSLSEDGKGIPIILSTNPL